MCPFRRLLAPPRPSPFPLRGNREGELLRAEDLRSHTVKVPGLRGDYHCSLACRKPSRSACSDDNLMLSRNKHLRLSLPAPPRPSPFPLRGNREGELLRAEDLRSHTVKAPGLRGDYHCSLACGKPSRSACSDDNLMLSRNKHLRLSLPAPPRPSPFRCAEIGREKSCELALPLNAALCVVIGNRAGEGGRSLWAGHCAICFNPHRNVRATRLRWGRWDELC